MTGAKMTPAVAPQKPQAGGPPAPKVRTPQPLSQGLGHCSPPLFPSRLTYGYHRAERVSDHSPAGLTPDGP